MQFELDGRYIIAQSTKKEVRFSKLQHKLYHRKSSARKAIKQLSKLGKKYHIFIFEGMGISQTGRFEPIFEFVE